MHAKETPIYLSADQLEERAVARIRQAEQLPPGEARQHALKNAAQLRSYAAMKRLLVPSGSNVATKANGASDVAIDRVMTAYSSKHDITPSQAAFVRDQISKFIDELMTEPWRAPMMFPETETGGDPDPRTEQQRTPESAGTGPR